MAKYEKGQSGNPSGRPKGALCVRTKILRDATVPTLEAVAAKAKEGDLQAAALILDRTVPRLKQASPLVEITASLPPDATLTQRAELVVDAVLTGRLDPVIGSQLITAIGACARVTEVDELKQRLDALAERIGVAG